MYNLREKRVSRRRWSKIFGFKNHKEGEWSTESKVAESLPKARRVKVLLDLAVRMSW